jgi:hypothetical protein
MATLQQSTDGVSQGGTRAKPSTSDRGTWPPLSTEDPATMDKTNREKRILTNPRSDLLEKGKRTSNLYLHVRASLPPTVAHSGRRRRGGERPETGKKGGLKRGRSPRRAVATGGVSQSQSLCTSFANLYNIVRDFLSVNLSLCLSGEQQIQFSAILYLPAA